MTDPLVVNDSAAGRYRLRLGGDDVGYLEYDPIGTSALLLKHTEIASGHEGKGFGSKLVRAALDDIRRQNLLIVPVCPYVLNFIRRNREYVDLVRAELRSTL